MSRNRMPGMVWNGAAAWDDGETHDEGRDGETRLPRGLALAAIVGISALLWGAILAPLSLI